MIIIHIFTTRSSFDIHDFPSPPTEPQASTLPWEGRAQDIWVFHEILKHTKAI